jgi:hypothetical protein
LTGPLIGEARQYAGSDKQSAISEKDICHLIWRCRPDFVDTSFHDRGSDRTKERELKQIANGRI